MAYPAKLGDYGDGQLLRFRKEGISPNISSSFFFFFFFSDDKHLEAKRGS